MIIVGITGTIGAGKGTIVDYLVNNKGFKHYSVRGYLTKEIEKRGMPVNRDSMVDLANELRRLHNPAFIVEELYKEAAQSGNHAVIESIRTPGEIDMLRLQPDFYLLAVDADPLLRFERIMQRKSETDNISFDTFKANEAREMESTDPNKQNLSECIRRADFLLLNNDSIQDLFTRFDSIFEGINTRQ